MKFSSGMYQRLGIARALMKRPAVVLLDEPTRSLDPGSAAQFWNLVRELPAQGATVILTTHNFNEAVAVGNHVAIFFTERSPRSASCRRPCASTNCARSTSRPRANWKKLNR